MEKIGIRIKDLRLKAGLKASDFSNIGISRSMLFLLIMSKFHSIKIQRKK